MNFVGLRSLFVSLSVGAILLVAHPAQARQFNFAAETLATYFRGTYGPSSVGETLYGSSSGNGVTVDKKVSANASGELGVVFSAQKFNLKLGVELLLPRSYDDIKGTDASGAEMFGLSNKAMALLPMANLELLAYQSPTSRMLVGVGFGMAFVSLDNDYKMTPAGTTALGVSDFVESASGKGPASQVYVGYELLFTDTVTAVFDAGYRYVPSITMVSTRNSTAISGAQTEGSDLVNMDGGKRTITLSGPFAGLAFRFYIGL